MARTLEVTLKERTDSCDLSGSLDVDPPSAAGEKSAPAASRSWKRRLPLVAATFCALALVLAYVGGGSTEKITEHSPPSAALLAGKWGGKEDMRKEDMPGGDKVTKEMAKRAAEDIVKGIVAEGFSVEAVRKHDFLFKKELMTSEITQDFLSAMIESMVANGVVAREKVSLERRISFSDIVEILTSFLTEKKGLRIQAVTALQPLMGDQQRVGHIHEVVLKGTSWANNSFTPERSDMVANFQGFLASSTHFVPTDKFPKQGATLDDCWPDFVPGSEGKGCVVVAEAGAGGNQGAWSVKTLRQNNVKRVRFAREAMRVLLGSVSEQPAAAGAWNSLAASALGVCFDEHDADDEGARGWLASELLEGRVRRNQVPLVLDEALQQQVMDLPKGERSAFLAGLDPGDPEDGGAPQSAFVVIASFFKIVRELSDANIVAILDVDDLFSLKEGGKVVCDLVKSAHRAAQVEATDELQDNLKLLLHHADMMEDPHVAAIRRSGPRFLAHCLLLLEKRSESDPPAAEYLRQRIQSALGDDLLQALQHSSLTVWRGSTIMIDGAIAWGLIRPGDGQREGLELISVKEYVLILSSIQDIATHFDSVA